MVQNAIKGHMNPNLAQAFELSQVTGKEIFLLLVGLFFGGLLSWYASCVVARYLYFRQNLDQAMAYVLNTAGVLKPAALSERLGIAMGVGAVVSGFGAQLLLQGHKAAADAIKANIDEYTANLYTALKEMHALGPSLNEQQQIAISGEFKDWLTLQNGAYMMKLGIAGPNWRVILFGFDNPRKAETTVILFTFDTYRNLTPEQKKPKKGA